MKDFVIMNVKNFIHAQNYQNLEGNEKFYIFLFVFFFSLHMYNSNTNSLIIVGAHLKGKKQRVLYNLFP